MEVLKAGSLPHLQYVCIVPFQEDNEIVLSFEIAGSTSTLALISFVMGQTVTLADELLL